MTKELQIKIKYKNNNTNKIQRLLVGDWIDLSLSEDVVFKRPFQFELLDLGVAMKLPEGYEAIVAPRSSTYKKYNIIQANGIGVIDNSYSGNEDWWKFPALFLPQNHNGGYIEPVTIKAGTRICQFRIQQRMGSIRFATTQMLDEQSRGGFGSTGD